MTIGQRGSFVDTVLSNAKTIFAHCCWHDASPPNVAMFRFGSVFFFLLKFMISLKLTHHEGIAFICDLYVCLFKNNSNNSIHLRANIFQVTHTLNRWTLPFENTNSVSEKFQQTLKQDLWQSPRAKYTIETNEKQMKTL